MNREPDARKAKYGVFLVDNHPIVRHGLTQLINREPDLMVCGESEDESEALTAVAAAKPDVVMVGLILKRSSGFSLIKNLNALDPKLSILVLTIHDESLYAERCLRAGAKGYLMKEEAMENVLLAIRRVLAGQVYLSEEMQEKLFRSSGDVTSLFRAACDVSLGPEERTQNERQTVYDRREDSHPAGGGRGQIDP